jgi:hypothetical protein
MQNDSLVSVDFVEFHEKFNNLICPPREGFFVSDGWAEPYQPGDLFQLATPDMSSKVAKQETP